MSAAPSSCRAWRAAWFSPIKWFAIVAVASDESFSQPETETGKRPRPVETSGGLPGEKIKSDTFSPTPTMADTSAGNERPARGACEADILYLRSKSGQMRDGIVAAREGPCFLFLLPVSPRNLSEINT